MIKSEILILGAGPAGMACAMELFKANKKATIIEKDDAIGGLAKTLSFKEGEYEFRTDIGPHRFFSKNPYLYEFIENLLNEKWIKVNRKTRQLINGKFYDYPIKPFQAFKNIGPFNSLFMGLSYLQGILKFRILKKEIISFEDYIVSNFGKSLGDFNMLNYTEKIWGTSCKDLHPDWAKQRIKGLNLTNAVLSAMKKDKSKPKTLVDQFYYPEFGTGLIYETIAEEIKNKGFDINLNSYPTSIKHKDGKITLIEYLSKNKTKRLNPKFLVSSIPITELLSLLNPKPPKDVMDALSNLKWRAQCYLFITLDKKSITDDNWIYFPDIKIPFGRVAEMKNFSKKMSPEDKTSMFIEFFVTEGDKVWNMSKEELLELSIPYFEKLKLFKKEEIRNSYLLKRKNVYPVYDLDYIENLRVIKEYLDKFENLYYIGRPGRFKYNNQDHSLEMGIAAAKGIIENKRPDFDAIGSEDEYFEKGEFKEK
jgi:protoporphyrinogen oxidase